MKKWGIVFIIAIAIFSFFRWLIGLGMSEIAMPFSIGITVILTCGGLIGRHLSRIWFSADFQIQNRVIAALVILIFASCLSFGLLMNRMISHTEFVHFFFAVISMFLASLGIGVIIFLIRHRIKDKIQLAQSAMVHSKSELQVLQSQLSPHFLFNTLNNLYGLSITDHEKVPDLLLRLSELLRYSVYDTKELYVPLVHELDYLRNYIIFEKIRLGNRLELNENLAELTVSTIQIAPMLLIVFVENAFKHAKNSKDTKIYIDINFELRENGILFTVRNSYYKTASKQSEVQNHSGFGLESARKRLNLLYENSHALNMEVTDTTHLITLRLDKK